MTGEQIRVKQQELRELRQQYTERIQDIQKKIDTLELEKYDCGKYLNKWLEIPRPRYKEYFTKIFLLPKTMTRLYRDVKYSGTVVRIKQNLTPNTGHGYITISDEEDYNIPYFALSDVKFIDAKDVVNQISAFEDKFNFNKNV